MRFRVEASLWLVKQLISMSHITMLRQTDCQLGPAFHPVCCLVKLNQLMYAVSVSASA